MVKSISQSAPILCTDPVYGRLELREPLLVDIYRTQALQRLASIHQAGITAFIKPERTTTRLDHSVGVVAVLQHLGAGVAEQAAGLLHDVPHTAFSHVVDFVFPNQEHSYHEDHRVEMLRGTDLPTVISAHGFLWEWLSDAENFSLLEQPLPALCADRLDYFLRDAVATHVFSADVAREFMTHLQVHEGRIVVDSLDVARWLGEQFIALDDAIWCSQQEVGWYAVMAKALQVALSQGHIVESDFLGTDVVLFERLSALASPEIQRWLALLRPDVDFVRDDDNPDLLVLPKPRSVDPSVLRQGSVCLLSQLDASFAQLREAYLRRKAGQWGLRICEG